MSKQWNEEQLQAIQTRHKNILVSASAGSGKTGVLVQRLVDLVIQDRIEINEILAMTFSEDAAGEMKKRLSQEITKLANQETNEEMKSYLNTQLAKLPDAHISTIHSFCYSIIKEYYYLLGLTSKRVSTLCDASMQVIYQNQALSLVMENEQKKQDPSFIQLCAYLSSRPENLEPVKEMILKVANMANSQSNPSKWMETAKSYYDFSQFETHSHLHDVFMDYWNSLAMMIIQSLHEMIQQVQEHAPHDTKRLDALHTKLEVICRTDKWSSFDLFRECILSFSKLSLPTSFDASNQIFKNSRELIQSIEDEVLSVPPSSIMKSLNDEVRPVAIKLLDCVEQFFHAYETIKCEEEVIDFSDMEHFALELLVKYPFVSAHYRELFKEIMVDEFQDSNDVQDELVALISQKNNVFRVGDVKQSIYGFRHALPSIMQSYKEKEDEFNTVIRFNKNYRSDANIVEFNNVLFSILMNIQGFDSLPFKEEDFSQIGLESQKENNAPIIFHALNPDLKRYETEKIKKDEYKAEYIAHEIINQLKDHTFRDFAVLVRNNSKMEILKQVFEKYHIPYYMNQKTGFYESRSIQILISLFTALCNPHDDLHFAALLTSPFFMMDSSRLAESSKQKDTSYYDYFMKNEPNVIEKFEQLRTSPLSISQILKEAFQWNDFYENSSLQDQTNCDYFFEIALNYENTISCECDSFIQYIENLKQQETAQTSTIGKNDNVVRFMSIHNSKGLEFPIVYLWSTSSMRKMENSDMVLCDNELGIGFNVMQFPYRNIYKTYQRIAIEQKKNRDEIEEELRILYVATTRAKNQLHLVDFLNPNLEIDKGCNYSKVNARKGTTSWILQALVHLNRDDLFKVNYVDKIWETTPLPSEKRIESSMPHYVNDEIIEYVSPSETENFYLEATPLSFSSKSATNRGTLYHAYLEKLPNDEWTRELIQEVSITNQFEIDDLLIENLLTLNQNQLFRNLRSTKIYHEYPFLVQDHHQVLHGFMDFLSISDEIVLIDFKSDTVKDRSILINRYTQQIATYKKACELLFPSKVIKTYMYSFSLAEMIQI